MPDLGGDEPWDSPGPPGSTPLDPDSLDGLIPTWIATRGELSAAEQDNILSGLAKRRWRRPGADTLLSDHAARDLHADLFGSVWSWAGTYRQRETTIGIDPVRISVAVRDLMDDARWWFLGDEPMPPDEAGYRLHHRLVQIHPFPNGNGRHARELTNLVLRAVGRARFTWGQVNLDDDSSTRDRYISALRAADGGDYGSLAEFVRS